MHSTLDISYESSPILLAITYTPITPILVVVLNCFKSVINRLLILRTAMSTNLGLEFLEHVGNSGYSGKCECYCFAKVAFLIHANINNIAMNLI